MAIILAAALAPENVFAQPEMVSVDSVVNGDGTLNLGTGRSGTLDLRGWNVQMDPKRGPILTREMNAARFAGGQWAASNNNGLNGEVFAIAVIGSDVYVGGTFTETEDGAVEFLNAIARYNSAGWSALPNRGLGNESVVFALAVMGSDLYVGGRFRHTGMTRSNS